MIKVTVPINSLFFIEYFEVFIKSFTHFDDILILFTHGRFPTLVFPTEIVSCCFYVLRSKINISHRHCCKNSTGWGTNGVSR